MHALQDFTVLNHLIKRSRVLKLLSTNIKGVIPLLNVFLAKKTLIMI